MQPRAHPRFHRAQVQLRQRHAPRSHLRVRESTIAVHRKLARNNTARHRPSIITLDVADERAGIDPRAHAQRTPQPLRQSLRQSLGNPNPRLLRQPRIHAVELHPGQPVHRELRARVAAAGLRVIAAHIQHARTRNPEVRTQRRVGELHDLLSSPRTQLNRRRKRQPRKFLDPRARVPQHQRHQRGKHRRHRVPKPTHKLIPFPIRPRTRERHPARRNNHAPGTNLLVRPLTNNYKSIRVASNLADTPRMHQFHSAHLPRRPQQRIQHRVRIVRRRKKFARLLPLEPDAQLSKELHRPRHIKRPQHFANRIPRRPRVRALIHRMMRHVAPPAPRHKNLRPKHLRAVERDNRGARTGRPQRPPRPDRGKQTRGSRPDDCNVRSIAHRQRYRGQICAAPRPRAGCPRHAHGATSGI